MRKSAVSNSLFSRSLCVLLLSHTHCNRLGSHNLCVCVCVCGIDPEKIYEMALETLLTSILLKSHSPTFFCRRRLSGRFAALPTYCALSESFLLNQLLPAFRQSSQSVICTPLWIVCRCSTGTVVVLLRTIANGHQTPKRKLPPFHHTVNLHLTKSNPNGTDHPMRYHR